MKRTPLRERLLPDYSKCEERLNTLTHTVGAAFGIIALVLCLIISVRHSSVWAAVSSAIYGCSMIALYTVSSVYHGLRRGTGKKVMQVLDHCTIYLLIAGTYTPIVLCAIRPVFPGWGWTLFGIVWGLAAMAAAFTAIDLKKYRVLSMCCYIGMGWCILIALKPTLECLPFAGFLWLLAGGISYTIGAVLYGVGKKKKYIHSLFHVFVVLGSVLQFVCIAGYVI